LAEDGALIEAHAGAHPFGIGVVADGAGGGEEGAGDEAVVAHGGAGDIEDEQLDGHLVSCWVVSRASVQREACATGSKQRHAGGLHKDLMGGAMREKTPGLREAGRGSCGGTWCGAIRALT